MMAAGAVIAAEMTETQSTFGCPTCGGRLEMIAEGDLEPIDQVTGNLRNGVWPSRREFVICRKCKTFNELPISWRRDEENRKITKIA